MCKCIDIDTELRSWHFWMEMRLWKHLTPASSWCSQLWIPQPLWSQSSRVVSAPLQLTSFLHRCNQKSTTRMLVTFGMCLKQYFDTRYLVFYNTSPPRMFLSPDFLWEYRIQHGANGPLYVTPSYSTWIFCRGVSGFATDCPCGVWCRGLTTCLLHVGPPFGNRILNNSWAVGLT